eukprot:s3799_g3.t2
MKKNVGLEKWKKDPELRVALARRNLAFLSRELQEFIADGFAREQKTRSCHAYQLSKRRSISGEPSGTRSTPCAAWAGTRCCMRFRAAKGQGPKKPMLPLRAAPTHPPSVVARRKPSLGERDCLPCPASIDPWLCSVRNWSFAGSEAHECMSRVLVTGQDVSRKIREHLSTWHTGKTP